MRADALGFFWQDEPIVKIKKEKTVCTPPDPVWLSPDYLPGLAEAQAFKVDLFDTHTLVEAAMAGEHLILDIECYVNYFLVGFQSFETAKVVYFELYPDSVLDVGAIRWIIENFTTVGFNSLGYDLTVLALALDGATCAELKGATNMLIGAGAKPADVLRSFKTKKLKCDHIDLIEVAPLFASLKIYGGRMHTPKMQDLPFAPETVLSKEQIDILRWYWVNDLTNTCFMLAYLREQIQLRRQLGGEYGLELRSKSDAQIAEAVIGEEIKKLTGSYPRRPTILPGTMYRYNVPHFLKFKSPLMQQALWLVANTQFEVSEFGNIGMPQTLRDLEILIGDGKYRMGIGGLHSTEHNVSYIANDEYELVDRDVTSFYPMIIIRLGLAPDHLGKNFLKVYESIVQRRIEAKRRGDKVVAESLKITVNGSYGKLGSQYSILYAPNLLIQVTLTGQLSLLMLIEHLELAGFKVVSANTDGVVTWCARARKDEYEAIIAQWERDTGFNTEETLYTALYSRDVNNYIAVKVDGGIKNKGAFFNPWAKAGFNAEQLSKNPQNSICIEAVQNYLVDGVPVEDTILECKDVRKFVSVRTVNGGAAKVWDDGGIDFLGKAVRWYYAQGITGSLVYALSGKRVPKSSGAKPLQELPAQFPEDVNYDWYIAEANKILEGFRTPL